jgi:hypothetical protein
MPQNAFPWNGNKRSAPSAVPPNLSTIPQWVKVGNAISYTAFSAVALTNTISLFLLPPAAIIHGIKVFLKTSFTGGSVSAYTISVGDGSTAGLDASAFNVFQAPGPNVYQLSSNFGGESLIVATQIYATATSVGANLNAATAGTVDVLALLSIAI